MENVLEDMRMDLLIFGATSDSEGCADSVFYLIVCPIEVN